MTQVSNRITKGKTSFSSLINSDAYQQSIKNSLQSESRAKTFTSAIVSAVTTNPTLQECTATSIISSALLGESLNLSPSPQLGHYYLVPFNNRDTGKVATFQIGYKGYLQLAIRSGQYKKINVLDVKEGELVNFNPLTEEIEVELIEDEEERENAKTIGYYAMFELVNGFQKAIYWSKPKMERHAIKYSKGYQAKKGYTFWEKDFDGMAFKTMLRQLISKWGIMSIELQKAYEKDMTATTETGETVYVDDTEGFEQEKEVVIDIETEKSSLV